VRRHGRCTVQALQPQQVAAIVHDGDGHSPLVLDGFGFSSSGYSLDVRPFEFVFGRHGNIRDWEKIRSYTGPATASPSRKSHQA
jgi:hypothetical protein